MSRKKSSPSNIPAVDGRHNMTSLELSEADDLATLMTVDAILGFTTHKMDKNFNPAYYDKKLREKWKEIMEEFIVELNYESTYQQLIFTDKIKSHWKKDERFKRHIFRFLYLFDKRSGIEVRPCYRYMNEDKRGAAIFATREWEKGSQISTLFGCISEVRQSEEEFFHENKNEFSVMYSTRKNCSQLWLGPAAYVNHDCKPNCRFTEANYDSKMTLETLRDIHPNDELLIYYGNNFFGSDNIECECFTCELRGRGMYSHSNIQQNSINSLNGICFSQTVTPRSNGDFNDTTTRRVITRSAKTSSVEKTNGVESSKMSLTRSLQGALNGLKKSDDSYCFRITYSRIDRVKQKISRNSLAPNSSPSNFGTPKSKNISLKRKLKHKSKLVLSSEHKHFKQPHNVNKVLDNLEDNQKSSKLDSQFIQRRSLRQANAKNLSINPVLNLEPRVCLPMTNDENRHGKLTIKLRKTAEHPNQYEHCLTTSSKSPIQKLTLHKKNKYKYNSSRDSDSNIFSRMNQLLLSQSDNTTPTPQSDTPPFLSPWFCSEKSSSHSSKKSKSEKSKTKIKLKSSKKSKNHLKIINLNTKPIIKICENNFDFCFNVPETSSSDIPSYSASSPTIPILEIESETELVPPQLVCELPDGDDTNSQPVSSSPSPKISPTKSKGIVMKFSRICGNRFISLLS